MNRLALVGFVFLLLFAVLSLSVSHAAQISLEPNFVGFYDPITFEPIDRSDYSYSFPVGVQIDVYMKVLSLAPGEDSFGSTSFDFDVRTCGCSFDPDLEAGGWGPYPHPNVDSNGPAPGGLVPLFPTNADIGLDIKDYKGVLVQMATGAFTNVNDPRRNVGEAGSPLGSPILLGSAFFEVHPRGYWSARVLLNPLEVTAKRTDGTFVPAVARTQAIDIGGFFGECPEPSSIVLLTSCLAGLCVRPRVS